ncbi:hypothetical protein MP228_012963 [Amoeboaphelidium protococcarum]|nr:hypothetical protein MP228_012963 [Amoeboaphelidium protococcarum]
MMHGSNIIENQQPSAEDFNPKRFRNYSLKTWSPVLLPSAPLSMQQLKRSTSLNASDMLQNGYSMKKSDYFLALQELNMKPFIQMDLDAQSHKLIFKFLRKVFGSQYNISEETVNIELCTDGITNKLLKVTIADCDREDSLVVLIRIYGHGTSSLIDRDSELMTMFTLEKIDLAPPLYGRFLNGFCYGYSHGRVLKTRDLFQDSQDQSHSSGIQCWRLIARALGDWHRRVKVPIPTARDQLFEYVHELEAFKLDGSPSPRSRNGQIPLSPANSQMSGCNKNGPLPCLWNTVEQWFDQIECLEQINGINIKQLQMEIDAQRSKNVGGNVVFCHNDLLSANIILTDQQQIRFIDYEYGSWSYAAFDIANHFNEFAGFKCDYSRYPLPQFQQEWLKEYLAIFQDQPAASISDQDVIQLMQQVDHYQRVSHLYWCVWALVQSQLSDIDFDYQNYAQLRWTQYLKLENKL